MSNSLSKNQIDFSFPVGFIPFHKQAVYNFQFNRWYSLGYADYDDLIEVSGKINSFGDWARELILLAEKAESQGRIVNAAYYYRAAEFYIAPNEPDKNIVYTKFKSLIHDIMIKDGISIIEVPFEHGFLPCLKKASTLQNSSGTIVIHGGFDSLKEEFYSIMNYLSASGFDVVVFEGPGQGDARRKHNIPMDYKWEKPTSAVLDYFNIDDATLLGVSMGGYLCFRAAAFDSRIKRVIASSIAYDYTEHPPKILQPIIRLFYNKLTNYTNNATIKAIKKGGMKSWYFTNLMYMLDKERPIDAIQYLTSMTAKNLHSEKVMQDVLILTGRDDHLTPFKMHQKQLDALINAKSVTSKVFYKDSSASNHCQIGNMKLNFDTILDWINQKSNTSTNGDKNE